MPEITASNNNPLILVVDNDKSARLLLTHILKSEGCVVIEAEDEARPRPPPPC